MTNNQIVQHQIHAVFSEVQYLIRLLYVTQDVYMRNLTLNQLWNKIDQLQFLIQLDQTTPTHPKPIMPIQQPSTQAPLQTPTQLPSTTPQPTGQIQQPSTQDQQSYTLEQLAQFNGQNGRPAYVAVKGIVYDVTNNAAWSAATHFGLEAGRDWTQEFASCHAAEQWILNTLTPVGRLVS